MFVTWEVQAPLEALTIWGSSMPSAFVSLRIWLVAMSLFSMPRLLVVLFQLGALHTRLGHGISVTRDVNVGSALFLQGDVRPQGHDVLTINDITSDGQCL